jgi:hypothetical protein
MEKKVKVATEGGGTTYLELPQKLYVDLPKDERSGYWIEVFNAGPWSSYALFKGVNLATFSQAKSLLGTHELKLVEVDPPDPVEEVPPTKGEKAMIGKGLTVTISEEAIASGAVTFTGVDHDPEAAAAPETGTFENPRLFSAVDGPQNTVGMIAGSQHPGYDSIYGVNYTGFALGWYLQRMNNGTLYFTNAGWTEFMECPFLPPPNPTSVNYPVADLPS